MDKSYPCEINEDPQKINDEILYEYWSQKPINEAFDNDELNKEFKDFEIN